MQVSDPLSTRGILTKAFGWVIMLVSGTRQKQVTTMNTESVSCTSDTRPVGTVAFRRKRNASLSR